LGIISAQLSDSRFSYGALLAIAVNAQVNIADDVPVDIMMDDDIMIPSNYTVIGVAHGGPILSDSPTELTSSAGIVDLTTYTPWTFIIFHPCWLAVLTRLF